MNSGKAARLGLQYRVDLSGKDSSDQMLSTRRVVLGGLALAMAAAMPCSAGLSAEEALSRYAASLDKLREPVAFTAVSQGAKSGDWNWKVAETRYETETHAFRQGSNVDYRSEGKYWSREPVKGKQMVVENGQFLSTDATLLLSDLRGAGGIIYMQSYRDPKRMESHQDLHLDGNQQILDGRIPGDDYHRLPELLSQQDSKRQLRDHTEDIDGHPCLVLDAQTKYGKHTLWLDPDAGYLPRRIEVKRGPEDYRYGEKLNTPHPSPKSDDIDKTPSSPMKSEEIVVDKMEIAKVGDAFWPIRGSMLCRDQYVTGETLDDLSEMERRDIRLGPDFAALGAFQMNAPDGTEVWPQDEDPSGIAYQWQHGQIVPVVPAAELVRLDSTVRAAIEVAASTAPMTKPSASVVGVTTPLPGDSAPVHETRRWTLPVSLGILFLTLSATAVFAHYLRTRKGSPPSSGGL